MKNSDRRKNAHVLRETLKTFCTNPQVLKVVERLYRNLTVLQCQNGLPDLLARKEFQRFRGYPRTAKDRLKAATEIHERREASDKRKTYEKQLKQLQRELQTEEYCARQYPDCIEFKGRIFALENEIWTIKKLIEPEARRRAATKVSKTNAAARRAIIRADFEALRKEHGPEEKKTWIQGQIRTKRRRKKGFSLRVIQAATKDLK